MTVNHLHIPASSSLLLNRGSVTYDAVDIHGCGCGWQMACTTTSRIKGRIIDGNTIFYFSSFLSNIAFSFVYTMKEERDDPSSYSLKVTRQ
mmetsp:Transcript_13168/g.12972  ORF Transcript_13168/g.12972 Transcript_13168/m.12972 type:complete len:91 (-) Transcript_13168:143-415(-)